LEPEPSPDLTLPMPLAINYLHGPKTGPWIGIAPFAKFTSKVYPVELMEVAIAGIASRAQKVFIFGGGSNERRLAEQMASRGDNIVPVIGIMGLGDELNLISNLDVMVTMDSVSMQMASLVGTPVVSVWGGTHPYAGYYGFGQDPANAVQLPLECRPCSVTGNKLCKFTDYRCLTRIAPEEIVRKVWDVCEKTRPAAEQ
jgi:ADP-heptose:LPS heptosyltransferase